MKKQDNIHILVKLALEFNAVVIAYASLIHNRTLDEKGYKRAVKTFKDMFKEYEDKSKEVLKELEKQIK